jgi:hypothetical protein
VPLSHRTSAYSENSRYKQQSSERLSRLVLITKDRWGPDGRSHSTGVKQADCKSLVLRYIHSFFLFEVYGFLIYSIGKLTKLDRILENMTRVNSASKSRLTVVGIGPSADHAK